MKSKVVDERLAGVRAKVFAGEHYETSLELFRVTYFPALSIEKTVETIGAWCSRHDLKPDLKEQRVELGGKTFRVVYLLLSRR